MILTKPFNVNLSYTEGIKSFATFLFVLFSRLLLVTMMNRQHGKYIFLSDVMCCSHIEFYNDSVCIYRSGVSIIIVRRDHTNFHFRTLEILI